MEARPTMPCSPQLHIRHHCAHLHILLLRGFVLNEQSSFTVAIGNIARVPFGIQPYTMQWLCKRFLQAFMYNYCFLKERLAWWFRKRNIASQKHSPRESTSRIRTPLKGRAPYCRHWGTGEQPQFQFSLKASTSWRRDTSLPTTWQVYVHVHCQWESTILPSMTLPVKNRKRQSFSCCRRCPWFGTPYEKLMAMVTDTFTTQEIPINYNIVRTTS